MIFLCTIVPSALIFYEYFLGYFRDLLIRVPITKPCRFESILKHIVSNLRLRLLFLIMRHRNILSARFVMSAYNLKNKVPHVGVHLNLPLIAPIRGRGAKHPLNMSKSTLLGYPINMCQSTFDNS